MTAAPELTPELRARLEKEYADRKSIAAFLVWDTNSMGVIFVPFTSMAALYEKRAELTEELYSTEDFLVVNTFKEFEPKGD